MINEDVKNKIAETKAKINELNNELRSLQKENSGLFIGEKYYDYYGEYQETKYVFLGYIPESNAQEWKENMDNSDEEWLQYTSFDQVSKDEYEMRFAIHCIDNACEELEMAIRSSNYGSVIKQYYDRLCSLGDQIRLQLNGVE